MAKPLDGHIRFRKVEDTAGFSSKKLVDALDAAYLTQKRPDEFKTKKSFAPSSIGYGHAVCPRYWYLAFDGAPFVETTDAKSIAVMANGTAAHTRIQGALKDSGLLVAEEVEIIMKNPPVFGYMDCLIRMDDEVVVGEIKTTSEQIFALKQVSMKPSPNHLLQILLYLKATGKKRGFLLYENRNDLSLLVIEVDFNEKNEAILEDALEWMRLVYETWQNQTLPERAFRSQTVKVCANCPVNKHCWEDKPEGEIKIPKMEVPKV